MKKLNPNFVAILEFSLNCAINGIPREKIFTNDNKEFMQLITKTCHSIGINELNDTFWIELDRTDKVLGITHKIHFITGYDGPEYDGPRYKENQE